MRSRLHAVPSTALSSWWQDAWAWPWNRRISIARIGCQAVVVLALVVYATSMPGYFAALQAICLGEGCVPGQLSAASANVLARAGISLHLYATLAAVCNVAAACVWWAVGAVIFWRKREDWMALLIALTLVLVGATVPTNQNVLSSRWPTLLLNFVGVVALYLVFCLFPSGKFVPGWIRWLPLVYLALNAMDYFPNMSVGIVTWLEPMHVVLLFGCIAVLGGAQIYRYRVVSSASERHQTKWVVFGALATILAEFVYWLATQFIPGVQSPASLYDLLFSPISAIALILFIPVSLAVAIFRYRLYDIDVLINRALVYGTLTLSLAAVYAASVLLFNALLQAVIPYTSPPAVVLSTLIIAALFQPLRHRVQAAIDRRFYRRKYDAARAIEELSQSLRMQVDLEDLSAHLISVVNETLAPSHVSLWLVDARPTMERRASLEIVRTSGESEPASHSLKVSRSG